MTAGVPARAMPEILDLTTLAPGFVVAERYEVVDTIGEGGMGVVYRVRDRRDASVRALKILKDTSESQAASQRRFRREYRALAKLRHPAVVDVHDSGIYEGHLYFVMEFVQGHTLREWGTIYPQSDRTEEQLGSELEFYLQTMVTVLDALADVHRSGIVHRDLKPQNIMVDHEGLVRIMDFGVALELQAPASDTSSNMILGTVGYVSPEEVRGVRLDARADLYSVGAMIYEYVTGQPAFDDDNPILAFSRMLKERPVPPRKINPSISRELEAVVLKLMEREPEDRFQSAEEAAVALNMCIEGGGASSSDAAPTLAARLHLPAVYTSRFIGQGVALHLLGRLLEKSKRGHGHMALVVGEAGIGKTRLAQELAVGDDASSPLFLRGSCFEREGLFYQPYVEMMGEMVRRAGRSSRKDEILARLYDADLFPLLRELARHPRDEDEPTGEVRAEEKIRLFEAVARMAVDTAKRRPILMHLDDMHYADELTLELTRYMARNMKTTAILIVVALRPEELKRPEAAHVRGFLDDMRRENLLDAEVKLQRLSKDEVGELFWSLARWEPGAEMLDAVYRLTDGIPYFVEEVVKSLGPARPPDGAAKQELPIPATVAEIVQRQLMSFTSDQREVLRDAAHIGTDFEFDLLLQVTGRDEGQLLDLVDDYLRQGVLTEISTARSDSYRFTHPAVRELLLRQVGERKRRKLHLRIAEAMEELYHDRLEASLAQNIEEIARQYRLGGNSEKAFEYGWIAAKKALEKNAFDAGLRHLGSLWELAQAREIRPSPAQLQEMVLDLGTCYERTGRLTEARQLYEQSRGQLARSGDLASSCEVGRRLARLSSEEGRIDDAVAEIEATARAAASLPLPTRMSLETEMARLLEARGDHVEALSVLLTALQQAEAEGSTVAGPEASELKVASAEAMGLLGSIFTARGEHLEAARYLERALEIARGTKSAGGTVSGVLGLLAENAHQSMDAALEIRFYEEALRELDRVRDLLGAVSPMARMGRAYVTLGEMERGQAVIGDALKRCRRFALTRSLPVALEAQALHSLYRGRLRAARAELLEAFDHAESVGEAPKLFRVSLSLGQLLTHLKAYNEARTHVQKARELAEGKDNTLWRVQALTALAELDLVTDRPVETLKTLEAIEAIEASFGALITSKQFVPAYVVRGQLHAREEDPEGAESWFAKALHGLADVVAPYQLGLTHLRHAQALRLARRAAEAREALEQSRAIWRWLGTSHHLAACDEEEKHIG